MSPAKQTVRCDNGSETPGEHTDSPLIALFPYRRTLKCASSSTTTTMAWGSWPWAEEIYTQNLPFVMIQRHQSDPQQILSIVHPRPRAHTTCFTRHHYASTVFPLLSEVIGFALKTIPSQAPFLFSSGFVLPSSTNQLSPFSLSFTTEPLAIVVRRAQIADIMSVVNKPARTRSLPQRQPIGQCS